MRPENISKTQRMVFFEVWDINITQDTVQNFKKIQSPLQRKKLFVYTVFQQGTTDMARSQIYQKLFAGTKMLSDTDLNWWKISRCPLKKLWSTGRNTSSGTKGPSISGLQLLTWPGGCEIRGCFPGFVLYILVKYSLAKS